METKGKRELPFEWKTDWKKVRTEKSTGVGSMEITSDLDLRSVKRKSKTETGVKCNEEKTLNKNMYTITKNDPFKKKKKW